MGPPTTMSRRRYSSAASSTTLTGSISNSQTSITVASITGLPVLFPYVLILDSGTASEEAVLVTAGGGTTLTVNRGFDGTTGLSHTTGASVVHGVTAIEFDEANAHVNATAGVHGVTGDVVGTTDVQTLSNKTLTAPAASGSLTGFGGAWSTYTPALTSTGVAPNLGTSPVASGIWRQIGKLVEFQFTLRFGSSPTIGTGTYSVSLPTAAAASWDTGGANGRDIGSGSITDDSTVINTLVVVRLASSTTVALIVNGAGAATASTIAFAQSDFIRGCGVYEAA